MQLVKTTYSHDDVKIMLKDLTGFMKPLSAEKREELIQSGAHYSSMLPKEEPPSKDYLKLYNSAVIRHRHHLAEMIAGLALEIKNNTTAGHRPVIVSLARAGIPVGILIRRYLMNFLDCDCAHYAISIIRGKGIDINAMEYIYSQEVSTGNASTLDFFFVDGWTGKGAIRNQLSEAVETLVAGDARWQGLRADLYVLADPANITQHCGTHEDILLPTACLNSIVSGLISRSILNECVDTRIGDFHGAVYFSEFEACDLSNSFIDAITVEFPFLTSAVSCTKLLRETGIAVVKRICNKFDISDHYKVKPGIGETTRVLLRRVPWAVLLSDEADAADPDLQHIFALCKKSKVKILPYDLGNYKVCGIVKDLNSDV